MMNGVRDQLNELHSFGQWLDQPFNAADYGASAGATWTLGLAAILRNRYTIIQKTLIWNFYVSWFSGSNNLIGAPSTLTIKLPGNCTCPGNIIMPTAYNIDGGARVDVDASPNGATCSFTKRNGSNFTAGSPGIIGTLTFEIL
jgi:hypothetical protein